jgi:hypothetical protein
VARSMGMENGGMARPTCLRVGLVSRALEWRVAGETRRVREMTREEKDGCGGNEICSGEREGVN